MRAQAFLGLKANPSFWSKEYDINRMVYYTLWLEQCPAHYESEINAGMNTEGLNQDLIMNLSAP